MEIDKSFVCIQKGIGNVGLFHLHVVNVPVDMADSGMTDCGDVASCILNRMDERHFRRTDRFDRSANARLHEIVANQSQCFDGPLEFAVVDSRRRPTAPGTISK